MREAPLRVHPETGKPITRAYTPNSFHNGIIVSRNLTTDKKIAANGFQKYQRQRDGSYVRTVGREGPAVIHKQH
jgi:hypothetical protein